MINQAIRYIPIKKHIEKIQGNIYNTTNNPRILEIGSGCNGIGEYISTQFIGCDVSFNKKINVNLVPLKCSGEYLPFKDNTFELIISSDMLEHIESKKRTQVINEMVRVSKEKIIIACPCGIAAEKCEKKIVLWYEIINVKIPTWLIEHLNNGLPSENDISNLLNKQNLRYFVEYNENLNIHMIIMLFESIPFIGRVSGLCVKLFSNKLNHILNWKCFHNYKTYRTMFIIQK